MLDPNTTYYVRAYATNAIGTAYGIEISFYNPMCEIILSEVVSDISCFGADDGSITISSSGGTEPYTYAWDHGPTTQVLHSLAPGDYNVTVTDANLCTQQGQYEVSQPKVLAISGTVSNISCFGSEDGTIDITVSGGTAPYSFLWSNTAETEDISGLGAGSYEITVTDANLCTEQGQYDVSEPNVLAISGTVSNISCFGTKMEPSILRSAVGLHLTPSCGTIQLKQRISVG